MTGFVVSAGILGLLLVLSALFSGCETGVYSLSQVRLETEAREGRRPARLLRSLVRRETGLLITLLIGNNLMIELVTRYVESKLALLHGLPDGGLELAVTAVVTPVVFVLAELLPKDMFRRRPHLLLGAAAPVVALARLLFLPIALPLEWLSRALERVFGIRRHDLRRALGREQVREILREWTRAGGLAPHAEELAHNVLGLRETPVEAVMVPWSEVQSVDLGAERQPARTAVEESEFSRLPAIRREADGRACVVGYVHQLDVLRADDELHWERVLREIPTLPPHLPVDRALARLRHSGKRVALVGTPEAPLGLATLMDLVETISGDLAA